MCTCALLTGFGWLPGVVPQRCASMLWQSCVPCVEVQQSSSGGHVCASPCGSVPQAGRQWWMPTSRPDHGHISADHPHCHPSTVIRQLLYGFCPFFVTEDAQNALCLQQLSAFVCGHVRGCRVFITLTMPGYALTLFFLCCQTHSFALGSSCRKLQLSFKLSLTGPHRH